MADPASWYEWIKVAAFLFGLCFGGLAVGSPSWVLLRKHTLSMMGCWLATLGAMLISMSIWQSVEIETSGLKMEIAETNHIARQLVDVVSAQDAFFTQVHLDRSLVDQLLPELNRQRDSSVPISLQENQEAMNIAFALYSDRLKILQMTAARKLGWKSNDLDAPLSRSLYLGMERNVEPKSPR